VRDAIHELKYRHVTAMARPLATLMAEFLHNRPIPSDVIVPVPLHARRLKERGYNQSTLLAHELGKLTGIRVADNRVSRVRDAHPQVRTSNVRGRHANVTGAFSCRANEFTGLRVLIIDDVCTSGATLEACAAAVRNGGAVSIAGVTLAREI
jgi:ComF family protein